MTEAEFDHRLNVAYWQGKRDGQSDLVGMANVKAGDRFAARKDDAQLWREFAVWIAAHYGTTAKIYENLKNKVDDDECK